MNVWQMHVKTEQHYWCTCNWTLVSTGFRLGASISAAGWISQALSVLGTRAVRVPDTHITCRMSPAALTHVFVQRNEHL
jgi:hypothetical protein